MNEHEEFARMNKLANEWKVCTDAVTAAEELLVNCIPEYMELPDDPPVEVVKAIAKYVNKYLADAYDAGYEEGRAEARVYSY